MTTGASSATHALRAERRIADERRARLALRQRRVRGQERQCVDRRHQGEADHDPGDHAGHEQPADRHAGHRAVDDHRHRRRDDRADQRRAADDAGGEPRRVALLLHRRDHDRADGGGLRRRRARHVGHHHARHDRSVAEAAAQVADDGLSELDQRAAQAPVAHQRAGQDEIGHRQQAEVVEDGEHPLHEQRRREVGQDERGRRARRRRWRG